MDINIYSAFLPHDDKDAAIAFYCDSLGFELRNDVGYNGMHWLTVGPPNQPGTNIVLYPPGADPGITDDERRTITEEGADFRSHLDGTRHLLTPARAVDIQARLGSDIAMVLDECLAYPATHAEAARSMVM